MKNPESQPLYTPEEHIRNLLKEGGQFERAYAELSADLIHLAGVAGVRSDIFDEDFVGSIEKILGARGVLFNRHDTALRDSVECLRHMDDMFGLQQGGDLVFSEDTHKNINMLMHQATSLAASVHMMSTIFEQRT